MTLVTCKAPNFIAPAVMGNNEIIDNFNLQFYIRENLSVLFFWPMDFTFVCPSELISFDKYYAEFQKRNVKIIGVSLDSVYVHNAWRLISPHKGGIGQVKYPMVSDIKREIIKSYEVEHPIIGVALRATFIIDKEGIIRHQIINDLPFGRNINEVIRMIDAIQFHQENGEVCPAQWEKGRKGLIASHDGVVKYLSENMFDL